MPAHTDAVASKAANHRPRHGSGVSLRAAAAGAGLWLSSRSRLPQPAAPAPGDQAEPVLRRASSDQRPGPATSRNSSPHHIEKSVRASCTMLSRP